MHYTRMAPTEHPATRGDEERQRAVALDTNDYQQRAADVKPLNSSSVATRLEELWGNSSQNAALTGYYHTEGICLESTMLRSETNTVTLILRGVPVTDLSDTPEKVITLLASWMKDECTVDMKMQFQLLGAKQEKETLPLHDDSEQNFHVIRLAVKYDSWPNLVNLMATLQVHPGKFTKLYQAG